MAFEIDLRYQYLWEEGEVFDPPPKPLIEVDSVDKSVAAENFTLSPTAPTSSVAIKRNTLQGNIVLSPTAATVVRTAHSFINSLQGNISISSNSPDVQSGTNIVKSPARVDILLSPTAPIITRSANQFSNTLQGNLALSSVAPTRALSQNHPVVQPLRDLALSPTTPVVVATKLHFRNPPQQNLLLSSAAPLVARSNLKIPLRQDLALSPTSPSVTVVFTSVIRNTPQGNLALSSAAPTVVTTANSIVAPVITQLRTVSAQSPSVFWNISSGATSSSNELSVTGTSSNAGANANVFRDTVLQGSTVTDGSGNWTFTLPSVADGGPYNLTATINTSILASNTWTVTIGPLVNNFTNVPGATFTLATSSEPWIVQSVAGSISSPNTHTLRFLLNQGDRYVGDPTYLDRSEIRSTVNYNQGATLFVTYQFMYEAGPTIPGGQFLHHLELRNLDSDITGPFAPADTRRVIEFGLLAEKLSFGLRYCPTDQNPSTASTRVEAWTSTPNIVRGQWYRADLIMEARNDGTGYCKFWIDGTQVVNYTGPIGYGPYHNFWLAGHFRETQAGTQAVQLKNFLVSSVTPPVITSLRTVSAQDVFWDIANNTTTRSNNVNVHGTASRVGVTVSVYRGGVLQGTAVSGAGGVWKYDLGVLADGTYTVNALVTFAGVNSQLSNSLTFTIAALISNFTNVPQTTNITIAPNAWEIHSAAVAYNLTLIDTHTLRFEMHTNEHAWYDT